MNAKELIRDTERLLLTQQHCTLEEATAPQLHNALSTAAMEALTPLWVRSQHKRAGEAASLLPLRGVPHGPHGVQ